MIVRPDTSPGDTRAEVPHRTVGVSSVPLRGFLGLILLILPGPILLSTPMGLQAQAPGRGQGNAEPAPGETVATVYDHDSAPRARAARARSEIDVDGRLDEPVWAEAPAITEFIQENPAEREPGTQRTEFRVVYDDDAIYIRVGAIASIPTGLVPPNRFRWRIVTSVTVAYSGTRCSVGSGGRGRRCFSCGSGGGSAYSAETASTAPIPGSAGSSSAATWATCFRRLRTTFS